MTELLSFLQITWNNPPLLLSFLIRTAHKLKASPPESEILSMHKPCGLCIGISPLRGAGRKEVKAMKRVSFIRQTLLRDVSGRIDYISNPTRQEHLYATYETDPDPFWSDLGCLS